MKTRGGVLWEGTERDLPWQQSGEDVFLFPFSFPTSTLSRLSHVDILTSFLHGKSVQHTFCTAQLLASGQSVLFLFVEMLFSLFCFPVSEFDIKNKPLDLSHQQEVVC